MFEKIKADINALAHITGSGIENILRVMPENTCLNLKDWTWPEEFIEVQKRTQLSKGEMLRTLNCGLGLTIFCKSSNVEKIKSQISACNFKSFDLGVVEKSTKAGEAHFLNV